MERRGDGDSISAHHIGANEVSRGWTPARELHMRSWIVQMSANSLKIKRSASRLRAFAVLAYVIQAFAAAYTTIVPVATIGCSLWDDGVCSALQLSTIVTAVVSSALTILMAQLNPGEPASAMTRCAHEITSLARLLDTQLVRPRSQRHDCNALTDDVSTRYSKIIDALPEMPGCLLKQTDLLSLELLGRYVGENVEQHNAMSYAIANALDENFERTRTDAYDDQMLLELRRARREPLPAPSASPSVAKSMRLSRGDDT